jgi:hypothetical protein
MRFSAALMARSVVALSAGIPAGSAVAAGVSAAAVPSPEVSASGLLISSIVVGVPGGKGGASHAALTGLASCAPPAAGFPTASNTATTRTAQFGDRAIGLSIERGSPGIGSPERFGTTSLLNRRGQHSSASAPRRTATRIRRCRTHPIEGLFQKRSSAWNTLGLHPRLLRDL